MVKQKECTIIVDSREQTPLKFPSNIIPTEVTTLEVGDYAIKIEGRLDSIRIERKSLGDLFSSFSGDNYRREKNKITKAKDLGFQYIIAIESSCGDVRKGYSYRRGGKWHMSGKDGLSQFRQMCTISQKYDVPVHYFQSPEDMAFWVQEYLYTRVRNS